MPWREPPRPSELQLAIERGLHGSEALFRELQDYENAVVRTEGEAKAVCDAVAMLASLPEVVDANSPLCFITQLFESVRKRKSRVFRILAERGIPSLVSIVHRALEDPTGLDRRDVLLELKVLAKYGTRAGAEAIVRAARVPLLADSYLWYSILDEFIRHPQRQWLYAQLSDPIPPEFIGISLLDSASKAHDQGARGAHPFSTPGGIARLRELILDDAPDCVSYSRSAVCAIPFLNHGAADELLSLAFDHSSAEVQLEAAWAAARMGRGAGLRALSRACLDANLSDRAKYFLEALGQEQLIPEEANDEHFVARATFANWLAHPCELGCPPDEVEVVDHRTLRWPPDDELKPFWLVKYCARDRNGLLQDDVDVGLVGSITFCLFSYKLAERPPEDAYAIHCYWELTRSGHIVESSTRQDENYAQMIVQYTNKDLQDVELDTVCEISSKLRHPQQLVGVANCRRDDEPGWVVFDGVRSRFYSASEMPSDCHCSTVLMLHVGRGLLGFSLDVDRRPFLQQEEPPRDPALLIQRYERLLERERSRKKPAEFGILTQAFDDYVDALCRVRELTKSSAADAAYTALIAIADNWEPQHARDVCSEHSSLAHHFIEQVNTLVKLERHEEILGLISRFRQWWAVDAHIPLAKAALRVGQIELAQDILQQIVPCAHDWGSYPIAVDVAELWIDLGNREEAEREIMGSLTRLRDENRGCSDEDTASRIERWFQDNRAAYLRLFPERGEAELKRQGVPTTTL